MSRTTAGVSDGVESAPAAKTRISDTTARSVVHATFHLERVYDASSAQVWKAFTDPEAKSRWFGAKSDQVEIIERQLDARPGGRERLKGNWGGRVVSCFDAIYYDVIENERLVYCYEMHLDDRKISVSVATIQFNAHGPQTRLAITEQGAFLDGYDDALSRERGTRDLLDALDQSLRM